MRKIAMLAVGVITVAVASACQPYADVGLTTGYRGGVVYHQPAPVYVQPYTVYVPTPSRYPTHYRTHYHRRHR